MEENNTCVLLCFALAEKFCGYPELIQRMVLFLR